MRPPRIRTSAVFGMPLGLPLQISECDKKLVGGLTMYAPGAATCFERLGDQDKLRATAPVEDDSILIRFAANEAPAVMSGGVATGLVVGGKLEGLTFNTRGTDAQAQVMDALKQTFGEPTSIAPKQVQNSLGETFDTVDATWGLPQVEILFRAVTARVDVGLLSVDTGLGRDHRRQRAPGSPNGPMIGKIRRPVDRRASRASASRRFADRGDRLFAAVPLSAQTPEPGRSQADCCGRKSSWHWPSSDTTRCSRA